MYRRLRLQQETHQRSRYDAEVALSQVNHKNLLMWDRFKGCWWWLKSASVWSVLTESLNKGYVQSSV